jgi:hypothetical protein
MTFLARGEHNHFAPRWVERVFRIPLELKILGANLVLIAIALLMLFGPIHLDPTSTNDTLMVVAGLVIATTVNCLLVHVALRPVNTLAHVAWLVSEGLSGARVPDSRVADRELTQLSTTVNELLDDLILERNRRARSAEEVVPIPRFDEYPRLRR